MIKTIITRWMNICMMIQTIMMMAHMAIIQIDNNRLLYAYYNINSIFNYVTNNTFILYIWIQRQIKVLYFWSIISKKFECSDLIELKETPLEQVTFLETHAEMAPNAII